MRGEVVALVALARGREILHGLERLGVHIGGLPHVPAIHS